MTNLLIINSSQVKSKAITNLFKELEEKGIVLTAWEADNNYFGPQIKNSVTYSRFKLFQFFLYFFYFYKLLLIKKRKSIKALFLLETNEKLIITPLAKILKIKTFWIESPENNYEQKPKKVRKKIIKYAKKIDLITFCNLTKIRLLNLGVKESQIHFIPLGIQLKQNAYQDNIFSNIAKLERNDYGKKYFTIGTISDLSYSAHIENLFQSILNTLIVVPNLQIVIIGDGAERKNLNWASKQKGIDKLVWFVGDQNNSRKWMESFDVYIETNEIINFDNLANMFCAMSNKLPIISFEGSGFEEIIQNNKNGILIEPHNNESLTQAIIRLQQNKKIRKDLGESAMYTVETNHNLSNTAEKIIQLLNN